MPNNIEPGAEEAVFRGDKTRLKNAIRRSLHRDERLDSIQIIHRRDGSLLDSYGTAFGRMQFVAIVDGEQRFGWYGVSVNVDNGVSVYETIEWK